MRLALLLVLPLLAAAPAQAWGPVGHRVTGAIADRNLSGVARAQVRLLLGTEDLAEASTWPDDMRAEDRKSVVQGTSVAVRVDLGGRRIIQKQKNLQKKRI